MDNHFQLNSNEIISFKICQYLPKYKAFKRMEKISAMNEIFTTFLKTFS